jgi:hypothetical protein
MIGVIAARRVGIGAEIADVQDPLLLVTIKL